MSREARLANRTLIHGVGVALGDVDGDGWVDLYLCMLDRPNVLYRNLGGWRFEDVTERSGAGLGDRLSRGAVFADADGDGDLDLFVAVHGGTNALLLNDGSGTFQEVEAGFEGEWGSSTLALADIDGDEDLDAYFANYKTVQGDDLFSPAERRPREIAERIGDEFVLTPPFDEHYRLEAEGEGVLRFELADPDELYLNDGSGGFAPVDLAGGVFRDADGEPISGVPRDWGLVARFFDADDDGDADLFVANDLGSEDGFWLNEGGAFTAASGLVFRTESTSSMGVDFSDIDGDGDTDFVTTEMLSADPVRRREQIALGAAAWTPPGGHETRVSADRNTLQLNRGDGTWAETARAAGLAASEWTWGAMFLDVDLDGYEDLLITNGHGWDQLDGDTQEALRTRRIQVDWREELGVFPPLRLRNLAFRNLGDGTFADMTRGWGYGTEPDVSHGIAAADLDRDGDRDVVITRLDEPPLLLRNDAGRARVALRVLGEGRNTQAVGARVVLAGASAEGPVRPDQTRQVTAGGMYLSGSDPGLTFAMGDAEAAEATIVWPSGQSRTVRVLTNHAYEVRPPPAGETGETGAAVPASRTGLFAEAEAVGRHGDSAFDELARQPLVPFELSRGGPGVAWVDADADGDPDLLVGAGAGGRAQLAVNEAGRLADPVPIGAPAVGDHTSIIALPTSGRPVIIAGVSAWEARSPSDLDAIPPLARLGARVDAGSDARPAPAVPASPHATGPLAAADVDGDGDLDIFAGARATPGAYPMPADSRLLLADGGDGADRVADWVLDTEAAQTLRRIGLVSGAVFSDVDGDGDPDLILALEWGPVRLLENDGGRFSDATDAWGLGAHTGRWNGIATGDFNGDDRPDLVVTAWGTNTGRFASAERPVGVVASDFDGNGLVDLIEFETGADGVQRPVRDYLTLGTTLPFLRRAAPTFEVFARSSVDDLLGTGRTGLYRTSAVTLLHTVFLNVGGRFEARPLPAGAQLAPAFGVVVADFDRDGREDLFLAQNYFATPRGLGRHDAGRGAVLLGDGAGGFSVLDAVQSGVEVYGDGRGAAVADFDADGRWDLAVGQNGAETVIFRGRGGSPGLRVRLSAGGATPGGVSPGVAGARLRPRYADGSEGPAREIQFGSGYWSFNGSVQVLGRAAEIRALMVRWPDGAEETFPVDAGALEAGAAAGAVEVTLRRGEGS